MCASPLNSTFLRINCNGNRPFASGARESGLLGARAIDRTAETFEFLGSRKTTGHRNCWCKRRWRCSWYDIHFGWKVGRMLWNGNRLVRKLRFMCNSTIIPCCILDIPVLKVWFACIPWRHKDIWHDFTQCIIIIINNNILFVLLLIMCDVIIIATKQYKTRDPSERSGSGRWSYHAVREAQQGTGGVISFIGTLIPKHVWTLERW